MINIAADLFKKYWIHILVWALFIIYEAIVVGLIFGVFGHPVTYIVHYILIIILFYALSRWMLPLCMKGGAKAIWAIPLGVSMLIIADIISNYALDCWLVKHNFITHVEKIDFDREFILRVLYRCIYILGFSTAYYFLYSYLKVREAAAAAEKKHFLEIIKNERTTAALESAENAFLRAQINPHFLFNTLSYIHHHIGKQSPEAADAIIQLSDIMRYALNVNYKEGLIPIGAEFEHVEKLFNLHQMRRPTMMNLQLNIAEQTLQIKFIPLVLLTLAENMIKYADFGQPEDPATLSVSFEQGKLHIYSKNLIHPYPKVESTGKGLQNITSRLQYNFGEKVSCLHQINNNSFEVDIFLIIDPD